LLQPLVDLLFEVGGVVAQRRLERGGQALACRPDAGELHDDGRFGREREGDRLARVRRDRRGGRRVGCERGERTDDDGRERGAEGWGHVPTL
jgi:hypothetical protein